MRKQYKGLLSDNRRQYKGLSSHNRRQYKYDYFYKYIYGFLYGYNYGFCYFSMMKSSYRRKLFIFSSKVTNCQ